MEFHSQELNVYINKSYLQQGYDNERAINKRVSVLLKHHKLPKKGLDDRSIELLLQELASLDSNNFISNVGVGEREGRIFSSIVAKRHFYLSHGIGRSGDIAEVQPKAAGSSIIYKITTRLVSHALQISGLKDSSNLLLLPLATGMTLSFCLNSLKSKYPNRKYVIWPRIDQKSCFKSIIASDLIPIIIDNIIIENSMVTNINYIKELIESDLYKDQILCILSTTSCFAPRQPDRIDELAVLAKQYDIGHIINNAYGTQCKVIMKLINRAVVIGHVDAIIQSTDKNFMVPVGGAIVVSPSKQFIDDLSASYPGRANSSPIIDLFITLLSMGEDGYQNLLEDRIKCHTILQLNLQQIISKFNLSIINSSKNTISIAVTLDNFINSNKELSFLGSMLFQRSISGCRVVSCSTKITNISACSIGMKHEELLIFFERLEKTLLKYQSQFVFNNLKSVISTTCIDDNIIEPKNEDDQNVELIDGK
eukprot:gene10427-14007_t